MRILIVEDEYLIAAEISDILTTEGHTIVGTAASAEEVISILSNGPICDLAILDANLAGSSVSPVATALERRSIPFIVVSGYSQWELLLPLRKAPFVPKPVRREALLAAVANFDRKLRQQMTSH
ncbi:MAG: response regulator [Hyphomicrobium sp.]|nr:response regulator [Hyphomicrobium sp.]